MKQLLLLLMATSMVAGCNAQSAGSGAGVNAGKESSSTMEQSSAISRQRQLQDSKSARATASMPAMGLIADALGLQALDAEPWKDAFIHSRLPLLNSHDDALMMLAIAVQPIIGWEVDPMPEFSDLPPRVAIARREAYLRGLEVSALFSNEILSVLAAKVAERPRQDPEAAMVAIRKAWSSIPLSQLQGQYVTAQESARGRRIIDLSGKSGGVHWMNASLGGDFVCQATGCQLTLNGIPWFGNGKLSGNEFTIALESSTSSSSSRSRTLDQRQSGTAVQRAGANVGVGK